MPDTILVVNAGSSSLKFSLFEIVADRTLRLTAKGRIDGIGTQPRLRAQDVQGATLADQKLSAAEVPDVPAAMTHAGGWLGVRLAGGAPAAVGHRVVHGGAELDSPRLVDDGILATLEGLVPLAPLHQPASLHPIRAVRARFPGVPQVVCFDTAFHRGHPAVADRYALPEALYQEGVKRYGFHGLSYESIARSLRRVAPEIAQGRVVVAHLGNGVSMCALHNGRSVDSTMGFTALDGLPMGTRCGQLDPGVVLHLLSTKGWSVTELEHLLYHEAGLLGLSGLSNDVRDLLGSDAPAARMALDYFVYRLGREVGSLAGALGGLDALVFTAGIGENSPEIRARVCARAGWLGIQLDEDANRAARPRISAAGSHVSAWVIPTDEERMIAEHTLEVVTSASTTKGATRR